ncbi:hypothetical protein ACAG75_32890, partial [Klebsiella pneumoniae]|uniref:hypothetical protein n=1 Tax=Klebsiella pneumoniae TaxID=573 RepID=UPI00385E7BB3
QVYTELTYNETYTKYFAQHRGGKREHPQEHSSLCDWEARVQPTKRLCEIGSVRPFGEENGSPTSLDNVASNGII